MDKSAVGHDYVAPKIKHASQTDYSTGFGGKFGVQSDRIDKVISEFHVKLINYYKYYIEWFKLIFVFLF